MQVVTEEQNMPDSNCIILLVDFLLVPKIYEKNGILSAFYGRLYVFDGSILVCT